MIHTTRKARLKPVLSPPTPAPMISGVTPGTVCRPAVLDDAKYPMNAGRELGGRPSGRTAEAMLGPKVVSSLEWKPAPAGDDVATGSVLVT